MQEAWHIEFPPDRMLTDLQKVERHVRLLLPNNANIVLPSDTPPRPTAQRINIPEPDPSLWIGNYVRLISNVW